MEKTSVRRMLGVMMPFVIMVIFQRLGYLLADRMSLGETLRDALVFAVASAAGIFFFRMSCGTERLSLTGSRGTPEEDDAVPPFPERDSLLGRGLTTLVCTGALVVIMYLVTVLVEEAPPKENAAFSAARLVSLVLLHPILEEYVFRWLYYRELRPMHPIFAGLAQAVMFAIVHGSVGGMMYALFAGIALAIAMENTGSFAVAVAAHLLVNLRSFVFVTWLTDAETVRLTVDFVLVSVGFGAFLGLLIRRGLRGMETEESDGRTEDGD